MADLGECGCGSKAKSSATCKHCTKYLCMDCLVASEDEIANGGEEALECFACYEKRTSKRTEVDRDGR